MSIDLLSIATKQMEQAKKQHSALEAAFFVSESMSESDAKQVLGQLIERRYLDRDNADLAQMLATRLGVAVQWSHKAFNGGNGEWVEGRGI